MQNFDRTIASSSTMFLAIVLVLVNDREIGIAQELYGLGNNDGCLFQKS